MALNFFKIGKGLSLAPQSSLPSSPSNGDIIFDSNSSSFMLYQGGNWTTFSAKVDIPTAASLTSTDFTASVVRNSVIRLTGSTAGDVHGLAAGSSAKTLVVYNTSSAVMSIKHQSSTEATAANRIITPDGTDTDLEPGYSATLMYDDSQSRWIYVAPFAAGGGGGGGGNIFSGNTNLSGNYYGDVIVYGGDVTVTGNLVIHGNLVTDGALLCTGDYSIEVKNDLYVGKYFDYLPASGGQDIVIGGNMTVMGDSQTSTTVFGPYDIININPWPGGFGFTEVTTSTYVDPSVTVFTLETGSTNAPYTDLIVMKQDDYYGPGTTTILLNTASGFEFDLTDTWSDSVTVTTYQDVVITQKADRELKVQGDLHVHKLTGISAGAATRALNVFVGGSVYTIDSVYNNVVNPEILISGDVTTGVLSGGKIEVKGCVYDHSISTNGADGAIPGTAGTVFIGAYNAPSGSINTRGGSASGNVVIQNGRNGGSITIRGPAVCSALDSKGGACYGSGGGNGGFGGTIVVNGPCNATLIASGGEATVSGNGGGGGSISLNGYMTGGIVAIGGYATGAGKTGGNGGGLTCYAFKSYGSISLQGGAGNSSANGGWGGSASFYSGLSTGGVSGSAINMQGASGNVGGWGGNFYLGGNADIGNLSVFGGNSSSSSAGGRGGQIFCNGYMVAHIINAYGGNSTSGAGGAANGNIVFAAGVQCSDLYAQDGTGTANTLAVLIYLAGKCIFGSISCPNRTQAQIRAYGQYVGTAHLRVRALPIKDIFHSPTGINPTAAQAALCASRVYIYNSAATVWQYAAFTNA